MDVSDVESQEPVIEKVSVSELVAAHLKALHSMETSDHALQRADRARVHGVPYEGSGTPP